jgi:hypothetical protein
LFAIAAPLLIARNLGPDDLRMDAAAEAASVPAMTFFQPERVQQT